jgi:hypothetical protein
MTIAYNCVQLRTILIKDQIQFDCCVKTTQEIGESRVLKKESILQKFIQYAGTIQRQALQ